MPDPAVQAKQKQQQEPAAASTDATTEPSALQETLLDPLATPADVASAAEGGGGGSQKALGWRQALGNFLGDKLYDGLKPALSEESLKKYANDAWNGAVEKVAGWIKSQTTTPDESKIASKLTEELTKGLKDKAGALINFNLEGVAEDVADFARKNPELVILGALAGAAAYIATNQSIPALKQKLGLGKAGDLTVGAKFTGGFLDLFKSIDETVKSLELAYKVGGFEASADYERKEDGSREINADAAYTVKDSYQQDGKEVPFDRFKVQANGGLKLGPAGGVQGRQLGGGMNLNLGDRGQHQLSASGKFQEGKSAQGVPFTKTEGKLGYQNGAWSASASADQTTVPAATTTNAGLQGGYKTPNLSVTGNANVTAGPTGTVGTAGVQGSYKGGPLTMSGSAMGGTDGRYDINGKAAYDFGNGWKANGGAGVSNMPGQNGMMQQNWNVNGGVEYKKDNKFFNINGNYGNQGGGVTIGAGIRF